MFTGRKNKLKKITQKMMAYFFFVYGMLFCHFCLADGVPDPLGTSVKPQVQALLGPGSTVAYCIYAAEIVLGAVIYVNKKNLLTLLGVPILVLFTHTMFTYIGS